MLEKANRKQENKKVSNKPWSLNFPRTANITNKMWCIWGEWCRSIDPQMFHGTWTIKLGGGVMHMVHVWADMYKQFAGSAIKSVPISVMKYDK